jgi:hypothetical protein
VYVAIAATDGVEYVVLVERDDLTPGLRRFQHAPAVPGGPCLLAKSSPRINRPTPRSPTWAATDIRKTRATPSDSLTGAPVPPNSGPTQVVRNVASTYADAISSRTAFLLGSILP